MGKLTVAEQKALADDIYARYRTLHESLNDDQTKQINERLNDHSDAGDVLDQIALLHDYLESVTDGRPQTIDFSVSHGHPEERIKSAGQFADELKDDNRRLREWAACGAPGYEDKARIGGIYFKTDGLIKLREWIEQVIAWHKANPKRKADSP